MSLSFLFILFCLIYLTNSESLDQSIGRAREQALAGLIHDLEELEKSILYKRVGYPLYSDVSRERTLDNDKTIDSRRRTSKSILKHISKLHSYQSALRKRQYGEHKGRPRKIGRMGRVGDQMIDNERW